MSDCWSCGAERGSASFCSTCGKIQPIGRETYFEVLGLPRTMRLESAAIEKAFREASRAVHPDRFGQASSIERRLALEHTTLVNDAHRTLRDPQKRAEYLMQLEGVTIGKEESRTKNMALLGEMMELQEQVEEEKRASKLESLAKQMRARVEKRLGEVTSYFDEHQGTRDQAVDALNELRFLRRLQERIDLALEEVGA